MKKNSEVLILGAGLGGCACALALLNRGVDSVLLLDRPQPGAFRIGESATPDVTQVLEQLGLEKDLAKQGHRPCHGTLAIWGGQREFNDFLRRGQGHGWHLDRAGFDAHLQAQAVAKGAQLITPARLQGLQRSSNGWQALVDNQVFHTRLLVDAAGRNSPLAIHLGATRQRLDRLVALAVIIDTKTGSQLAGHSFVETAANGWWYAAPLPDGRHLISLMTDADVVRERQLRNPAVFLDCWQQTRELKHLISPPVSCSEPAIFAAHTSYLNQAAGTGWLALGDALLSFDPLTSSGMAGALKDALAATDVLVGWLNGADQSPTGKAYGERANTTLKRYLTDYRHIYGMEQEWSDQPFWQRRHQFMLDELVQTP